MLILLKCPLVELCGGSMGEGEREVVSSRCSRFTKDDRGRLFRWFEILVAGGWVAGWLDHPPCGSLK